MAVGETSGSTEHNAPVVSSGGRRTEAPNEIEDPAPLIKEADPEFAELLEEKSKSSTQPVNKVKPPTSDRETTKC